MVIVSFTKSKRGRKLKTPVTVDIPEPQNVAERSLHQHIIDACLCKMPRLLPFTFENASMIALARHSLFHNSGSQIVFYQYARCVYDFCKWLNTTPDQLVNECNDEEEIPILKAIVRAERKLDEYSLYLQGGTVAPNTVIQRVRCVRAFYRSNNVKVEPCSRKTASVIYEDRAPTVEELRKILYWATLRQKVIVSILAVSGLRPGTLAQLRYSHVKTDLEKKVTPVHLHVEANITKGKYHSYSTFLNEEAVEYLTAYLNTRRIGTAFVPPENICNESPLIRAINAREVTPISSSSLVRSIHRLYFKAGILKSKPGTTRYEIGVRSLRKFFRTQMAFLGVDREYIDYMMGHKGDTYFDAEMKGVEYLRHLYTKSGISIRPQVETGKLTILKEFIYKLGLNPEEILKPETLRAATQSRNDENKSGGMQKW